MIPNTIHFFFFTSYISYTHIHIHTQPDKSTTDSILIITQGTKPASSFRNPALGSLTNYLRETTSYTRPDLNLLLRLRSRRLCRRRLTLALSLRLGLHLSLLLTLALALTRTDRVADLIPCLFWIQYQLRFPFTKMSSTISTPTPP